jgi:hypothetical protein
LIEYQQHFIISLRCNLWLGGQLLGSALRNLKPSTTSSHQKSHSLAQISAAHQNHNLLNHAQYWKSDASLCSTASATLKKLIKIEIGICPQSRSRARYGRTWKLLR